MLQGLQRGAGVGLHMVVQVADLQRSVGADHIAATHVTGRTVAVENLLTSLQGGAFHRVDRHRRSRQQAFCANDQQQRQDQA